MKRFLAAAFTIVIAAFAVSPAHAKLYTKDVPFRFEKTVNGIAAQVESSFVFARPPIGQSAANIPDTSQWVDLSTTVVNSYNHGIAIADSMLFVRFILVNVGTATTSANDDTMALVPQVCYDPGNPLVDGFSTAVNTISPASTAVGGSICFQLNTCWVGLTGPSNPTTPAAQRYAYLSGARLIINTWDQSNGVGTRWALKAQYIVPDPEFPSSP